MLHQNPSRRTADRCNAISLRNLAVAMASALVILFPQSVPAQIKPGDMISPENADTVANLVSPGNMFLIKQGMQISFLLGALSGRLRTKPQLRSTRLR